VQSAEADVAPREPFTDESGHAHDHRCRDLHGLEDDAVAEGVGGSTESLAVVRAGILSAREGRRVEVAEVLKND